MKTLPSDSVARLLAAENRELRAALVTALKLNARLNDRLLVLAGFPVNPPVSQPPVYVPTQQERDAAKDVEGPQAETLVIRSMTG